GGIRIQVYAYESKASQSLQLRNAILRRHAGVLRQLTDGREVARQQVADAVDEIVRHARPLDAGRFRADVVRHAGRARRKNRQVASPFALKLQLRLHALHELIVGDAELVGSGLAHRVGKSGELLVAERKQLLRLGGVVAVDVDDHRALSVLFA